MSTDKTGLGDRMKSYEKAYTSARAMPLLPVIARLDGKAFHTWTKGLARPFDASFHRIMDATTFELVKETNAVVGYTQSDEITLVFYSPDTRSQIFMDGKLAKLTSILASMCTAYFRGAVLDECLGLLQSDRDKSLLLQNKPFALFDCRVFQVPTKEEVVNCLLWREQDASRNSVQSAAQSFFSNKDLYKKSTKEMQEMMFSEYGVNWNDYMDREKKGAYFRRVKKMLKFTTDEIDRLPAMHEARTNPGLEVLRTNVELLGMPPLQRIANTVDVIFEGKPFLLRKNEKKNER